LSSPLAARRTIAAMRVLSIDGGGIRGLLPATLVTEIEARSGKRAHELFDLMVGTSIGGITVMGLTAPDRNDPRKPRYSAWEILDFYAEAAPANLRDVGPPLASYGGQPAAREVPERGPH
jgi:patatin-like phospholipase/acyl hydrolase